MNHTRQSSFIRITVKLTLQPSGGYTVTCKELPELFTDGRNIDEALDNVEDALIATLELYEDTNKEIPAGIFHRGTMTNPPPTTAKLHSLYTPKPLPDSSVSHFTVDRRYPFLSHVDTSFSLFTFTYAPS